MQTDGYLKLVWLKYIIIIIIIITYNSIHYIIKMCLMFVWRYPSRSGPFSVGVTRVGQDPSSRTKDSNRDKGHHKYTLLKVWGQGCMSIQNCQSNHCGCIQYVRLVAMNQFFTLTKKNKKRIVATVKPRQSQINHGFA